MGARRKPVTLAQLAGQEHRPLDRIVQAANRCGIQGAHATLRVTANQAAEIIRQLDIEDWDR
ncbi:hypothetical protein BISA_1358 [Bifidobacterium saguini DSM 23967]|uniref:Uncharacterized protein n=1 Tax=Bifidobacterium saguini DSM 23967 TaxID=1437607 RepID=A0A087DCE3_9BIFI|nr:hypothetical protein [Bifidobacterium saguini]KFI93193.1 hypothetical protein BISA_1358 [Bifidobacterium saguini DSM 23967]